MEDLYRGYRIAVKHELDWRARVTHVRGHLLAVTARAKTEEGAECCLRRARAEIDRYLAFLDDADGSGDA